MDPVYILTTVKLNGTTIRRRVASTSLATHIEAWMKDPSQAVFNIHRVDEEEALAMEAAA